MTFEEYVADQPITNVGPTKEEYAFEAYNKLCEKISEAQVMVTEIGREMGKLRGGLDPEAVQALTGLCAAVTENFDVMWATHPIRF